MPNTYEATNELDGLIDDLIENDPDHRDLRQAGVTVAVLIFRGDAPLKLHGYPALATVKKTSLKDRALGMRDAIITVDGNEWPNLEPDQQRALIDHELFHLVPVSAGTKWETDPETGEMKEAGKEYEFDDLHRPKLTIRLHDVEVGWFVRMAQKHGAASQEVKQATKIMDEYGQLLFGFTGGGKIAKNPAEKFVASMKKAAGKGGSVTVSSGDKSVTIEGE